MTSGAVLALGWWGFVLLLGAVAVSCTARVFPARPAPGAAFAIPLGLAAMTMGTFWLGRLSFRFAPLAAFVLLAGLALVLRMRDGGGLPLRGYPEAAAVFTVGFGLVLLVKGITPAITASGETYWNFALIQSLGRTAQLPPQDPWFAGEPVRYYYGGHLLVAALAELLDTPGRYAFTLGKAVVFGALLTAAYGVSGAIAASRGLPHRPAGLLGGFFVGIASNLHPPIWGTLKVLPDSMAGPLAQSIALDPGAVTATTSFSVLDAAHFSFTNTDFPMYTVFLNGIHPHFVSPPFLLLLAGVLVAYWAAPVAARRRRVGLLALTTPIIGLIAVTNTWSLPTAGGLVALAVALAPAHPLTLVADPERLDRLSPVRDWLWRLPTGAGIGLLTAAVGLVWVAPYVLRGLAGDPGLGLLPPRSGPWFFIIGYGGFLAVFAAYLGAEVGQLDWSARVSTVAAVLVGGLLVAGWVGDFPGLVLVGPVLLGGLYLHARDRTDFTTVLLIAGAGLALLVEVAYVRESAEPGRLNTVYKVYMQTWVIWGPVAGVAVARLRSRGLADRRFPAWGRVFAVVVIVVLSIYAVVGVGSYVTYAVQEDVQPSLDGLAYLDDERPDYAAAIDWLAGHPGQPTLVSAPVPEHRLYQFNASPAASLTGIPTLVGWNHQADYRGDAAYRERVEAVDTIYAGTRTERAQTLRAYDVTFIWVGDGEHERYQTIDYSREPGITTAFHQGNVTIYRVDPSALDTG